MSLFCRSLAFRLLGSVEIDFLSDFYNFLNVIIRGCLLILIIIVIAITVVDVVSVVLMGAVTTQEKLASAAIDGAC